VKKKYGILHFYRNRIYSITVKHWRRSSVNFRRTRHFCTKNMYEKLTQCPNFRRLLSENYRNTRIFIFVRKINDKSRILHDFCPKIHEFYIIIGRKIFFPDFFWGEGDTSCPLSPPSPTSMNSRNRDDVLADLRTGL